MLVTSQSRKAGMRALARDLRRKLSASDAELLTQASARAELERQLLVETGAGPQTQECHPVVRTGSRQDLCKQPLVSPPDVESCPPEEGQGTGPQHLLSKELQVMLPSDAQQVRQGRFPGRCPSPLRGVGPHPAYVNYYCIRL